jgi:hypothetical protein
MQHTMPTQHFPTPQSPLVKLALKGLMFSVEALETSHPQLVHIVNPVLLWCLTFIAFIGSAELVLAGCQWPRRLLTFVTAGLLFQLLTLVQPALVVSAPCVAVLLLRGLGASAPAGEAYTIRH